MSAHIQSGSLLLGQVRTPVDVPLDLLPATQRLETLQVSCVMLASSEHLCTMGPSAKGHNPNLIFKVQEDMKIFSDETSKQAPPPKRCLCMSGCIPDEWIRFLMTSFTPGWKVSPLCMVAPSIKMESDGSSRSIDIAGSFEHIFIFEYLLNFAMNENLLE